jgi:uncharacterized protein YjdB
MKNKKRIGTFLAFVFLVSIILISVKDGIITKAETNPGAVVGTKNLNNTAENSAKILDILKEPEVGWKRVEDTDSNFTYIDFYGVGEISSASGGTVHSPLYGGILKFNFTKDKIRILSRFCDMGPNPTIQIDGGPEETIWVRDFTRFDFQALVYEKRGLSVGEHTAIIKFISPYAFDAVDIDKDGQIIPYRDTSTIPILAETISLDKSQIDMLEGNTDKITATVLPETATNKDVEWESSNTSVATVDQEGNVTAVGVGQANIVARVKGTELTASCIINVAKPSNDRAILAVTMTNGQTKEYDLPNSEIEAFTNWFDSSNGKGQPKFGFTKKIQPYKEVKEYVVFDKISSYEVRTYTVSN